MPTAGEAMFWGTLFRDVSVLIFLCSEVCCCCCCGCFYCCCCCWRCSYCFFCCCFCVYFRCCLLMLFTVCFCLCCCYCCWCCSYCFFCCCFCVCFCCCCLLMLFTVCFCLCCCYCCWCCSYCFFCCCFCVCFCCCCLLMLFTVCCSCRFPHSPVSSLCPIALHSPNAANQPPPVNPIFTLHVCPRVHPTVSPSPLQLTHAAIYYKIPFFKDAMCPFPSTYIKCDNFLLLVLRMGPG